MEHKENTGIPHFQILGLPLLFVELLCMLFAALTSCSPY